MTESVFESMPSGLQIAHYYAKECASKPQRYDGFTLFNDEEENSSCWVYEHARIDLDYNMGYLLAVQTCFDARTFEDFLSVCMGPEVSDVEWFQWVVHPSALSSEEWYNRLFKAIERFTSDARISFSENKGE